MRLTEDRIDSLVSILKLYLIAGLCYILLFINHNENGNIIKSFNMGILEYFKISILPFTALCITTLQFSIAYNNREISRKKNLIDLEDKTLKEFGEIKEILEAITITSNDSYKELLINLKVKDKSVEEKLLDKIEGKRFKFTTKYEIEEVEYKKQIKKMNSIIQRNINNTSFFLLDEAFFDLSKEDINSLQNNSKKINDYFLNNYKKVNTVENIALNTTRRSRSRQKEENKNLTWQDVQAAAKEMILIIDKI